MDDRRGSVNTPGDATAPDHDQRTRALRSEIDRTREDLSQTVDAIQEKLRPSNLVASAAAATTEKVKNMAHDAAETAEEWWDDAGGHGMVERVRNNPVPAVLAGVGLAWLALSNGRDRRTRRFTRGGSAQRSSRSEPADAARSARPGGVAVARRSVQRGWNNVELMVRHYPLAVGAAAAILGASLGMAVPETEQENEWLGEARDNVLQRAQDAAGGVVDRVKDAAADVVTRAAGGD
jgi:Protein of unknown function (DUF3618)